MELEERIAALKAGKTMINVYVNNRGWVMMYNGGEIRYTKRKDGAKPFPIGDKLLDQLRIQIEHTIMCHYDLVRA